MNLHLSARERLGVAALGVVALVGLVFGWRLLWFLTDDAFIAFRYVSNSVLGYGYVWNPPPFRPVEGYTSFLWVLLLDVVWRVSGMQPPVAANRLALIFAAINSILTLLMLLHASAGRLRPWRLPLAALALLGVLTNRTFLAWTSSGLETALFNCLVTAWVFSAVVLPAGQLRWLAALSVTAALSALTRPDGLLLVAATVGLVGLALAGAAQSKRPLFQRGAVAAPLLLVPIHLAWRYLTYGAWLPNTYYAKSATTLNRIESGSRYLRSFVVEYALWCWIALALAWAILLLVRLRPQRPRLPDLHQFAIAAVVLTLAAHLLYYTYLIGGDHFEFRVYSHLIPLLAVAGVAMLASLRLPPPAALGILALAIALSWPIPWLHWAESQAYTTRKQTHLFKLSVADALERSQPEAPGWLLSYLRAYDADQTWLINHSIGLRHQEHKVFYLTMIARYPDRQIEAPEGPGEPVVSTLSVGIVGWSFASVSVIDFLGLNDSVIAHNPELRTDGQMAHERQPPPGYLECFDPGLAKADLKVRFVPAERIRSCEARFWNQMTSASQTP